MTDLIAKATDRAQSADLAPLSALLEEVCINRGMDTQRHGKYLLAVNMNGADQMFWGCTGASNGKTGFIIARDPAWYRPVLQARGIPVPHTFRAPMRSPDSIRKYLEELGESASMWWRDRPRSVRQVSAQTLNLSWKKFLELQPSEESTQIVLEPAQLGPESSILVAFGKVLDAPDEVPEDAKQLAIRAVAALPGCKVAEVVLVHPPEHGYQVREVSPNLNNWNVLPYREKSGELVTAALEGHTQFHAAQLQRAA